MSRSRRHAPAAEPPSYGWALLSVAVASLVAGLAGALAWRLWSDAVGHWTWHQIVSEGSGLSDWDRFWMWSSGLAVVFAVWLVATWVARRMLAAVQADAIRPGFWNTFFALAAAGILASLFGRSWPFLAIVSFLVAAPAFLRWLSDQDF